MFSDLLQIIFELCGHVFNTAAHLLFFSFLDRLIQIRKTREEFLHYCNDFGNCITLAAKLWHKLDYVVYDLVLFKNFLFFFFSILWCLRSTNLSCQSKWLADWGTLITSLCWYLRHFGVISAAILASKQYPSLSIFIRTCNTNRQVFLKHEHTTIIFCLREMNALYTKVFNND